MTSQRNCVLRQRDEIIEEGKTSKDGLEFVADMGLEASELAAREALDRLRDAFRKVYPQASWFPVEAEYNISAEAAFCEGGEANPTLEVDDAIDIGEILGGEPQQTENPKPPEGPLLKMRWSQRRARATGWPRATAPRIVTTSWQFLRPRRATPRAVLLSFLLFRLLTSFCFCIY